MSQKRYFFLTLIDPVSLQQVGGVYRAYTGLAEIINAIPKLCDTLIRQSRRRTGEKPKLAVFSLRDESNILSPGDADVLARMLSIDLIMHGRFFVLRRSRIMQDLYQELLFQEDSGLSLAGLGNADNARIVASAVVSVVGGRKFLHLQIVDVSSGENIAGTRARFARKADLPRVIRILSREIAGVYSPGELNGLRLSLTGGGSASDIIQGGADLRFPLWHILIAEAGLTTGLSRSISRTWLSLYIDGGIGMGIPLGTRKFAVTPYVIAGTSLNVDPQGMSWRPLLKGGVEFSFNRFLIGTNLFVRGGSLADGWESMTNQDQWKNYGIAGTIGIRF